MFIKLVFLTFFIFMSIADARFGRSRGGGGYNGPSFVGTTKGEFNVSQGDANYNLEIITPKGTAGLKPNLSINYNSSNNLNGLLGVGFKLNGISSITKCNQTLIGEKQNSSRNYNYCLDGERLVLKNSQDSYGSNTEYITEIKTYSKIVKSGTNWTVLGKNGLRYEYESYNSGLNGSSNVIYNLVRIRDRNSNIIYFFYNALSNSISKIKYANNIIDFTYADRSDKRTLYNRGEKLIINKKLNKVSIKTNGTETSSYYMSYYYKNNKSIVTSIKRSVGRSLIPLYFNRSNYENNTFSSPLKVTNEYVNGWTGVNNPRIVEDINADGLADMVGFANDGVYISVNKGNNIFEPMVKVLDNFSYSKGWRVGTHSRMLKDMNADGYLDIVGFSSSGVYISINKKNNTFAPAKKVINSFGLNVGGWTSSKHPRMLSDMNGDGLTDVVGFGSSGVYISFNRGNNSFSSPIRVINSFGISSGGWEVSKHPRMLSDMNGDGLTDVVGFGSSGVYISINRGNNTFSSPIKVINGFGIYSGGWDVKKHPRMLKDMNDDGLTDIVGFSSDGVLVSINKGNNSYNSPVKVISGYTVNTGGWDTKKNLRMIEDVNSDGLPDIIGFSNSDVSIAINKGNNTFEPSIKIIDGFNYDAGWRTDNNPRMLRDMNGDGFIDVVGFSNDGVYISSNNNKKIEVSSIANGKDESINIVYTNLHDKYTYSSNGINNMYTYPNMHIKSSSKRIVKSYSNYDGVGGRDITSFKYKNFKINLERGILGFGEIESYNNIRKSKRLVKYSGTYPYYGSPESIESYINNKVISKEYYKYPYNSVYRAHVLQSFSPWRGDTKTYDYRLVKKVSTSYDYSSAAQLVTKTLHNENFDEYGNPKLVTLTTEGNGDKFEKIINNNYSNNEASWIIGQLDNRTTTYKASNSIKDIIKTTEFEYFDTTGALKKEIIEPNNTKTLIKEYKYTSKGNVETETLSGSTIKPRTTTYGYDSNGINRTKIKNFLGHTESRKYTNRNNIESITGPNGLTTSWIYDGMNRKTKETRADGTYTTWAYYWSYSAKNSLYLVKEKTNFLPESSSYYDRFNRNVRTITKGFDGRNIYTDTEYNNIGKVQKKFMPYFSGESASTFINTIYDELGRISKVIKPEVSGESVEHKTEYDEFTVTKIDPKGNRKATTFDALQKKIKVEDGVSFVDYEYDSIGNLKTTTDSHSNTITINYDLFGHKINMNDPDMGYWSYKHNALGELTKQTDAKGQITTFEYDVLGRKIKQTENDKISTWVYDKGNKAIGKLQSESSSNGIKKLYAYDSLGRLINEETILNKDKYTKHTKYDTYSRVEYVIEPNSLKIFNEYNLNGYLVGKKSLKEVISELEQEKYDTLFAEAHENEKIYYEKYLDLQEKIFDLKSKIISYEKAYSSSDYDSLVATLKGLVLSYEVTAKHYKDGAVYYQAKLENARGGFFGRRQKRRYRKHIAEYTRNANTYFAKIAATKDLISRLDFYLNEIARIKNELINLKDESRNYKEFNNEKNIYKVSDDKYNYHYKILERDSFLRVTKSITGNGIITNESYNNGGLLLETKSGYEDSSSYFRNLSYLYDVNKNVITREDKKLAVRQNYIYDSIDRLSNAYIDTRGTSYVLSYEYDELGNITHKSDVGDYTYSDTNPHQVIKAGNKLFEYDKNGNMIRNNGSIIKYSHSNKPIEIKKGSTFVTFDYDMNDNRFEKYSNGTKTHYVGNSYEKTFHLDGKIEEKNFIFNNGKVVAIYTSLKDRYKDLKTTSYLHYDNLGSVDTITNNLGLVEERMAYKPFGKQLNLDKLGNEVSTISSTTNRGYTGHEHILEVDLIHMNGRIYDATIGRFISADPNIFHPFDTQDFNRYSYTKNNPLKYTDPSGYGWGDNEGEDENFDSRDSSADTSNDNQAEENDFNGSEESGDGSGDDHLDKAVKKDIFKEKNKTTKNLIAQKNAEALAMERAFGNPNNHPGMRTKSFVTGMIQGALMGWARGGGIPGAVKGSLSGGIKGLGNDYLDEENKNDENYL